jgi:hypothetical protein
MRVSGTDLSESTGVRESKPGIGGFIEGGEVMLPLCRLI